MYQILFVIPFLLLSGLFNDASSYGLDFDWVAETPKDVAVVLTKKPHWKLQGALCPVGEKIGLLSLSENNLRGFTIAFDRKTMKHIPSEGSRDLVQEFLLKYPDEDMWQSGNFNEILSLCAL